MGRINKTFALLLTLIIAMSCLTLLTVKPANAQSIPKPSVPKFTLRFVDNSYSVPTTISTDPYTGKLTINQGYYVYNVYLVMAIKNQPLVYQYNDSFYYNVKVKDHLAQWDGLSEWFKPNELPRANATSTETQIILGELTITGLAINSGSREIEIPLYGQVDFQAQAMIGNVTEDITKGLPVSLYFAGQTSGYSNTQTITVPFSLTSTPTPTPTPTVPEFPAIAILPLLLVVLLVAVAVRHRRKSTCAVNPQST